MRTCETSSVNPNYRVADASGAPGDSEASALPASAPVESLTFAERWMRDGLDTCTRPGFSVAVEVDMTDCRKLLEEHRRHGVRVTYTHIFVQATALALARHPDLHQIVAGSRRHRPGKVNIALSVAGDSFVAPVLLIRDAAGKSLIEIAAEVAAGASRVREEQLREFARLRRWGWLVPLGSLRRALLRFLLPRMLWSREDAPAFQVTGVSDVDQVTPLLMLSTGVLAAGQVRTKPLVLDGRVEARLGVTLTCSVDHRVWDGRMAARFLNEVKAILESAERQKATPAARTAGRHAAPALCELARN
jgi:pyruvate dehydrogenase E2 component (dihydrolipoamide acetyltransferase)